jgi:predicted nucleic acid-binding protein
VRYVLDRSVAVRWQVAQSHFEKAVSVLEQFKAGQVDLVAPDVIVPELGHVLRKLVVGRKLDADMAARFLERFLSLPIPMEPATGLAREALDLALRHSATFYDSLYVALAIRQDLRVLTADQPMCDAFARLERTVHVASLA